MASLNIRVDDTLKKQAETVFADLGISLSAASYDKNISDIIKTPTKAGV